MFIPTHKGQGPPASDIAALPTRSGSTKNSTCFALSPESFTDFDYLAVFASAAYAGGGWPQPPTPAAAGRWTVPARIPSSSVLPLAHVTLRAPRPGRRQARGVGPELRRPSSL